MDTLALELFSGVWLQRIVDGTVFQELCEDLATVVLEHPTHYIGLGNGESELSPDGHRTFHCQSATRRPLQRPVLQKTICREGLVQIGSLQKQFQLVIVPTTSIASHLLLVIIAGCPFSRLSIQNTNQLTL